MSETIPLDVLEGSRLIELQPDDVIILECEMHLSSDRAHRIAEAVRDHFPGRKVLVFDSGLKFHAVRDSK